MFARLFSGRFAAPWSGVQVVAVSPLLALSAEVGAAGTARGPVTALGFDATSKTLLLGRAEELYRRDDDGRRRDRVPLPPDINKGRVTALAAAAKRAGVWYLAGPGVGVLRTEDGGRNWQARNAGLPGRGMDCFCGWRDPFNKTERLTIPPFRDVLTPQQTRAAVTYLKTLWTPAQCRFQREESRAQPFPPEAK